MSQDAPIDLALVGITCPRCLLKLGKAVSLTLTAEERMIAVRVLANDLARLPADYVDHARPVGV